MSAILDFFRTWWGGKLPDDHALWGFPMFWVARAGKVLQIFAGLVVVFDLLTAGWLTDWANRASVRAEQRGILILHQARIKVIRQGLMRVVIPPGRSASAIHFLIHSPPNWVPSNLRLTLTAYRNFHQNVIEQAKCENACKERLPDTRMCDCQYAYVTHRVEKLAMKHLSSGERAVVADYKSIGGGRRFIIGYFATLIAMASCGGILSILPSEWVERSWLGLVMVLLGIGLPLWIFAASLSLRGQLKWYRLNKGLADFFIRQAKKSPPFLAVKMVALGVFLMGAVLDLVAS
ncbi:hypothetical protein ABGB16_01200 [Micromonospora sp. B11E3]|uniref:hypothetical protein n=1 Tax=Micromonospora sp. B11E3 TaxID=3153562 RepID=UPI00325DAC19